MQQNNEIIRQSVPLLYFELNSICMQLTCTSFVIELKFNYGY